MANATATPLTTQRRFTIGFNEILNFAYDAFCSNKLQFLLTALAMAVGTGSVILVVTIGLTGKQYVLRQIQAIGANMIYADYQGGAQRIDSTPDPMTVEDVQAVREQVPSVVAASPTVTLNDRISVGGGKQRDILVMGVAPEYMRVRNLTVLAGRFFDSEDSAGRNKVGVITDKLALTLYGSYPASIGQIIKLSAGLPFTIVGVFKESVDTFGQSEIQDDTMLIPYTVSRFFTPTAAVYQIYFSVASAQDVIPATAAIKHVLQSRHRAESVYSVQNLTQLLAVAERTANALTVVLMLVAFVTLLVSGIGIMNIMLASVLERTREIGVRRAIGARQKDVVRQFLIETTIISLTGGVAGILLGVALSQLIGVLAGWSTIVTTSSIVLAFGVSVAIGIVFGLYPAVRASRLDPVKALHYE